MNEWVCSKQERWRDGEMERWRDGERERERYIYMYVCTNNCVPAIPKHAVEFITQRGVRRINSSPKRSLLTLQCWVQLANLSANPRTSILTLTPGRYPYPSWRTATMSGTASSSGPMEGVNRIRPDHPDESWWPLWCCLLSQNSPLGWSLKRERLKEHCFA